MAKELTRQVVASLSAKKNHVAMVVALSGNLGSGKTTFTQAFLKALGVRDTIASPTFVLSREYTLKKGFYKKAYHLDVYRLSAKETNVLELRRLFKEKDSIVFIEWAGKIKRQLPKSAIWIYFEHGKKPHEREVKFCYVAHKK